MIMGNNSKFISEGNTHLKRSLKFFHNHVIKELLVQELAPHELMHKKETTRLMAWVWKFSIIFITW